jgi:hypothetical protein
MLPSGRRRSARSHCTASRWSPALARVLAEGAGGRPFFPQYFLADIHQIRSHNVYHMSGGLLSTFRKGNTSELLADYLLSSIGICTPVRRQDDYGFDCYCQLSDQENGYLTFGNPFIIQIKSNEEPITYGSTNPKNWKQENVSWLFQNKLPFFIGIVNREKISISIYDTTGLWQVYNSESYGCSQIQFRAKQHPPDEQRKNVEVINIENWPQDKGDGLRYVVDLGSPIVEITYSDLSDDNVLARKKMALATIVYFEQKNIVNRDLGIRAFLEIKHNVVNVANFGTGMTLSPHPFANVQEIYRSLKIPLMSLLIKLKAEGKMEECEAIKKVLRYTPKSNIDPAMFKRDPDLFNYLSSDWE